MHERKAIYQKRLENNIVYLKYMEKIVEVSDEFQEIRDVLARYETLVNTHLVRQSLFGRAGERVKVSFLRRPWSDDLVLTPILVTFRRVARNSQWGGLFGAEPPAAGGQWGSGGEVPTRRRLGVWEKHGGLGAEPPALENFAFFCKNNFILGLFWLKNNAFKTWLRNCSANKIKLVA